MPTASSEVRPSVPFTPAEAAAILGVDTKTIYNLVHERELRAFRIGTGPRARIRIPRGAIEELLGEEIR
jgi:excisionase family DNA binding protein